MASVTKNFRRYSGFLVFFVSVLLTVEISWVILHERPKELIFRSIDAVLIGAVLGILAIWAAARPRWSPKVHSILEKLAHALWPSVVLLFLPFHAHWMCRWQQRCGYLDNFFFLEFIVALVLILAAMLYPYPDKVAGFLQKRLAGSALTRTFSARPYLWAFFLSLTILLTTGWDRFINAEFFAEGGWVFLGESLNEGWRSIFTFVDGFPHLLPRLFFLTGLAIVPLELLAHYVVTICFLIAALINALIVRPEYRWLIPSTTVRWGICIAMSIAPGYGEMLGNTPTLHYMLFVFIGLVLLKDPQVPITRTELVAIIFSILSAGLFITLAPLALFRLLLRTRYLKHMTSFAPPAGRLWPEISALLIIVVASLLLAGDVFLDTLNYGLKEGSAPRSLEILLFGLRNALGIYYLLHPFGGNMVVFEILPHVSVLLLLVVLLTIVTVLFYIRWREDRVMTIYLGLWLLGVLSIPVMIYIARPDSFHVFFSIDQYHYWWHFAWWMRYNYLVAVPAIIFWFIILRPVNLFALHTKASVFALLILASLIYNAQFILPVKRYQEQDVWKHESVKLAHAITTGCPKTLRINVIPDTYFTYTNKNSTRTDCKHLKKPHPAN